MGTGGVGGGMERQGSAHSARAERGSPPRARLGTARGKRPGRLSRASKGAAQVILGVGWGTRKAGGAELQNGLDLGGRDPAAQQALCDPQIGDAPIRGRETLRNLQAAQAAERD